MDTAARLNGFDRRPCHHFSSVQYLKRIIRAASLAALVALALAASGCFNTAPPQPAQLTYPGPDEYAAYGYANDPSFAAYDPFLYNYYWLPPYYYSYYGGDGGRDCDDGFCGPRIVRQPPHLPWRVSSLAERPLPRGNVGVTQGAISTQPAESAPSTQSTTITSPGLSTVSDSHVFSAPSAGFGGGGFHSGGFGGSGFGGGGGFHGSFHR